MTRLAAIDVGSNAMRMRIVSLAPNGDLREIATERAAVRLGREVFLTGNLTPNAMAEALGALKFFREAMTAHGVENYRAVATSAVRDAANGEVLVERAEREARIRLEIISGSEEARLARVAVTRSLALEDKDAILVDIGGGSVEITAISAGKAKHSISLPMGTVRLSESFLDREQPVSDTQHKLLLEYIERMLLEASFLKCDASTLVIATGGNADFLADLCPSPLGDRAISVALMQAKLSQFRALSPKDRAVQFGMRADRADVVVPAIYVLSAIATKLSTSELRVPGVGLKDGILIDLADRLKTGWKEGDDPAGLERQALALGRHCRFDEPHAEHVANLATELYDATRALHELGASEREWLRLAALLHDIGDFVGYDAHHKHSYYLIANAELSGISPLAKEIVANVARYHRKAFPDLSHSPYQQLDKQSRSTVRKLSAMLRIADSLDREHRKLIAIKRVEITDKQIRIEISAAADVTLSLWTARRKADLLQELTGREVHINPIV